MIGLEDVSADMLAQARGCEPTNLCYMECVAAAADDLRDDRRAAVDDEDLKWINRQDWIGRRS